MKEFAGIMIVIIDYGMGNLGSIYNMLSRLWAESIITSNLEAICDADKLILPGVVAFDKAMNNLDYMGITPILNEQVLLKKVPILGICLGMQLLSKSSEEGKMPGLGWIDAETVKFNFNREAVNLRIPHMGWNTIEVKRKGSILDNIYNESRFYFVHSYHTKCRYEENVLATTDYGITFHSAIIKENIIGTQFHPEKSHKFGLKLLRNFIEV